MHPNPIFHDADTARNLAFARQRGFGMLTINGTERPLISHVPVLVAEDGESLDLHLVRSNPIARALKSPMSAGVAISGPDGYVSPDWYGVSDQVPTWNYVAVHLSGVLELRPEAELRGLLARQSAFYEARLLPKPPWTLDKMSDAAAQKMMRMIVPARMRIEAVDGTWKLSQNKPPEVIARAADHLEAAGYGVQTDELAAMMRGHRT
jgi:transcriptional regulator